MFHKKFAVILMKLLSEQCEIHTMVTKLKDTYNVYNGAFTPMF